MKDLTLQTIKSLIEEKSVIKLRELFEEYNDVDIAEILDECSDLELLFIFKTIPSHLTAGVFTYFNIETKERLANLFSGEEIKNLLNFIETDEIIDFIEELPANLTKKILKCADSQVRKDVNFILNYEEHTAGAIMNIDYVEINENDTCQEAIQKFKDADQPSRSTSNLYVVDNTRSLVGVIHLRDIILADKLDLVKKVMDLDFVYTTVEQDQEEVAQLFKKYDVNVLPVLNSDLKLVGIITVDDIIDIIDQEATEDFHRMAAITPTEKEYLKTSVWTLTHSRIRWLLILMISATFTSLIMNGYENHLALLPAAISFYIPLLMDSGGNAGSQTTTTIIRALAVGEIGVKDYLKVFIKELNVGLMAGSIMSAVNFGWISIQIMIGITSTTYQIAFVVSIALLITICISKTVGSLLPIGSKLLKLDPALMASPLLTTIVDSLALIVYFTLAVNLI